jgi:hypothetical protein
MGDGGGPHLILKWMSGSVKLVFFNLLWLLAGCVLGWLTGLTWAQGFWPMGIFAVLTLIVVATSLWWVSRRQAYWRMAFIYYTAGQALGITLFFCAMMFFSDIFP